MLAIDKFGNSFRTMSSMYRYYGTSKEHVEGLVRKGYSREDAVIGVFADALGNRYNSSSAVLTAHYKEVEDFNGNKYSSAIEMCRAYEISFSVFRRRRRFGFSLEDALLAEEGTLYVDSAKQYTEHERRYRSSGRLCRFSGS